MKPGLPFTTAERNDLGIEIALDQHEDARVRDAAYISALVAAGISVTPTPQPDGNYLPVGPPVTHDL